MLDAKCQSPGAKTLPKVLLGQLGCGLGKSVVLALLARYMVAVNPDAKILVCTPSNWVTHQLCGLFPVTKYIEEVASSNGIFLLEHKRLAEVDDKQLAVSSILVDEVDVLLANQELKAKTMRAKALIGLSATLGGSLGL